MNFFCHQPPPPDEQTRTRVEEPAGTLLPRTGCDFRCAYTYIQPGAVRYGGVRSAGRIRRSGEFSLRVCQSNPCRSSEGHWRKNPLLGTTVDERSGSNTMAGDAIIAMGYEAGGQRGMFLSEDLSSQVGTFALVPQIVDAVTVPVIAAGAIADARGVAAAFMLGASAVQVGTAYLFTPEAKVSASHHKALRTAKESETAITNIFTGRPARGILNRVMRELGPISAKAPAFPLAGGALMPLRAKDDAQFANLWAGQAFTLGQDLGSAELTRQLAEGALAKLIVR